MTCIIAARPCCRASPWLWLYIIAIQRERGTWSVPAMLNAFCVRWSMPPPRTPYLCSWYRILEDAVRSLGALVMHAVGQYHCTADVCCVTST